MLNHVLEDFLAAVHAKINIDVRHAFAGRVEEAFKNQTMVNGIQIGDPQTLQRPFAVAVGDEAPHQLDTGVAEGLVVQIHRILSRQPRSHPIGTALFEERQQRSFRGRIRRVGRQDAVDLVHVEKRP